MSIMHESSEDGHHQAIRDEMVSFGERLMRAGHMEEAQQVFCRLVQIYPGSAEAHASLGEFYLMIGDRERARKNFARSLSLCPENLDVRAKLSRLRGET